MSEQKTFKSISSQRIKRCLQRAIYKAIKDCKTPEEIKVRAERICLHAQRLGWCENRLFDDVVFVEVK